MSDKRFFISFMDGRKEVGVGAVVYSQGPNYGRVVTIESFGNKYANMNNGEQYDMNTGSLKSVNHSFHLWSSEEAYKEALNLEKTRAAFRGIVGDNFRSFSKEAILEAAKILGVEEELTKRAIRGR